MANLTYNSDIQIRELANRLSDLEVQCTRQLAIIADASTRIDQLEQENKELKEKIDNGKGSRKAVSKNASKS